MSQAMTELIQKISAFTSFDELESWATSQVNVDEIRAVLSRLSLNFGSTMMPMSGLRLSLCVSCLV